MGVGWGLGGWGREESGEEGEDWSGNFTEIVRENLEKSGNFMAILFSHLNLKKCVYFNAFFLVICRKQISKF